MTEGLYVPGFCVTRRKFRPARSPGFTRVTRKLPWWTLHVDTCAYVKRGTGPVMPAPATPYLNTVECPSCRPNDPHRKVYTVNAEGFHVVTCHCGLTSQGVTADTARGKCLRAHREREIRSTARGPHATAQR